VAASDRTDRARKARHAFLRGAEAQSWRDRGRWLTEAERRQVMAHFPGDPDVVAHAFDRTDQGVGCEVCRLPIGPDDFAVLAVQRLDVTNQDRVSFPEYIDGMIRGFFHDAHWHEGTTLWRGLARGRFAEIASV
jgi:hypothetical protein